MYKHFDEDRNKVNAFENELKQKDSIIQAKGKENKGLKEVIEKGAKVLSNELKQKVTERDKTISRIKELLVEEEVRNKDLKKALDDKIQRSRNYMT